MDRACPYALPAWVKTPMADSQPHEGSKTVPPVDAVDLARTKSSFVLRAGAGRLVTSDGSGSAWGVDADGGASSAIQAVRSVAAAPPGVELAVAAALVDLGAGEFCCASRQLRAARSAVAKGKKTLGKARPTALN
jgi:hypothetical protein